MNTKIITDKNIAARQLKLDNVIALPAETVYGLGANALNEDAVLKIYEVKERPRFNPLIVHIYDKEEIYKYAEDIPKIVLKLMDAFSPGPLTYILKKKTIVPDIVTAGLDTVALRIPAHIDFREILKLADLSAAAPSANRSGKISPTTAEEAYKELDGKIEYIFDGGKCEIGLESTVIYTEENSIRILRPGFITAEDLRKFSPDVKLAAEEKALSPGMLKMHYEPSTPLYIVNDESVTTKLNGSAGVLNTKGDIKSVAKNLYSDLRMLDEKGFKYLIAEKASDAGIGSAVNDRLSRAAKGYITVENNELKFTNK